MLLSKSYFYQLCTTLLLSSFVIGAEQQPESWTKRMTPRVFKSKSKQVAATQEYTVTEKSTLELTNFQGTIVVKSWEQNKVILDAVKSGTEDELSATTINVNQKNNNITIETKIKEGCPEAAIDYTLMVPVGISIKVSNTNKGDIKIKQIRGAVHAKTEKGSIDISDTVGTVRASNNNGPIKLKQKNIVQPNTIFLETLKGDVQLYVPKKINADIQAKTFNGSITSTIPVTLSPYTMLLNKDNWKARQNDVLGLLGIGGAPIIIDVSKGNITLEEY